jgi:negative regulator of sigma E activity
VAQVLARWQEPEALVFRVLADDGRRYRLTYHLDRESWTVFPEWEAQKQS